MIEIQLLMPSLSCAEWRGLLCRPDVLLVGNLTVDVVDGNRTLVSLMYMSMGCIGVISLIQNWNHGFEMVSCMDDLVCYAQVKTSKVAYMECM